MHDTHCVQTKKNNVMNNNTPLRDTTVNGIHFVAVCTTSTRVGLIYSILPLWVTADVKCVTYVVT